MNIMRDELNMPIKVPVPTPIYFFAHWNILRYRHFCSCAIVFDALYCAHNFIARKIELNIDQRMIYREWEGEMVELMRRYICMSHVHIKLPLPFPKYGIRAIAVFEFDFDLN